MKIQQMKSFRILANSKGMSITIIMILIAVFAIITGVVVDRYRSLQAYTSTLGYPEAMRQVRDNLKAVLDNDGAWLETISSNPNLQCLTDKSPGAQATCTAADFGNIKVFEADGASPAFVDSNIPVRGFTIGGEPCMGFGNPNNTDCIFRYTVSWRCAGGACAQTQFRAGNPIAIKPAIEITATLQVSNSVKNVFERYKLSAFNFTLTRGVQTETISKFCNMLPGGVYSQASKDCVSWFQNPDGFDCEAIAGPHYWFAGFDSNGQPICVADQKLGRGCLEGSGVVGFNARGEIICFTY